MNYGGNIFHYSMAQFQLSLWELLQESLRQIAASLVQTDLATREGKALGQIQEQIVGSYGVTNMQIEDSDRVRSAACVTLSLFVKKSLTPEGRYHIRHRLAQINRRYETSIRISIITEKDDTDPV